MFNRITVLASAIPCLLLSWALINVWISPMEWDNGRWVPYGVGLLLMEFLILHSGIFISAIAAQENPKHPKPLLFLSLFAFYLVMGIGFALSTDSPTLIMVLAGVMLGRFVTATNSRDPVGQNTPEDFFKKKAAFGILVYLGCTFASVFIDVPELGITKQVLDEVYPSRGGGLWEKHPEQAIFAGALYFGITGLADLIWHPSPRAVSE